MANDKRIILGTMTMGPEGSSGARTYTVDETRAILEAFKSHGYDELDCARVYCEGKTEGYLRDAGYKSLGFKLATKVYPMKGDEHDPPRLRELVEQSLTELGDVPDLFYLHAPNWHKDFEPTLACVDALYKEGKFKRFGISNFTAFQVAEVSVLCRERGWVRPTVWQGMYNAITRRIDPELITACRKYGLEVVVYNPIAGGLLSNRTFSPDALPESGRFADHRQGAMYRKRYFRDAYFNAVKVVQQASTELDIPVVDMAFRWLVHHSKIDVTKGDGIILGCSSKQQLEGNLKALEGGPLPDKAIEALDEAWRIVSPDSPDYWHGEISAQYKV